MKLITKNFRLNALTNEFSAAIYQHITQQNGGEWFSIPMGDSFIRIDIVGGISGVRALVDAYCLEALAEAYQVWEPVAVNLIRVCIVGGELTEHGRDIWAGMVADMGSTIANNNGGFHA